jgi:hypothetical protein
VLFVAAMRGDDSVRRRSAVDASRAAAGELKLPDDIRQIAELALQRQLEKDGKPD